MSMMKCNVCSCDFDIESEGGIDGNFGILPVSFCPTCYSCMCDMVDQTFGDDDPMYQSGWNSALEMAAFKLVDEFKHSFGQDTLASIAAYIKGFKK